MDIPAVKGWPAGAAQCHGCGGHGCGTCEGRGWFPPKTREEQLSDSLMKPNAPPDPRRKCENSECGNYIPPDHVAVYCSNDCAFSDA